MSEKALGYVRVSSRAQVDGGYSLPAQRKALLSWAAEKGLNVVAVYEDKAQTATKRDRAEFQEMLRRVHEDPSVSYVLVHNLDRFARNLDDFVDLRRELKNLDVRLISVTEDFGDSPTGRLAENIKASVADWYSHNLSVETKKGQRQKAETGWYPSVAPVGYLNRDEIIVQDETRAPLIREAFTLYASGSYTLTQLAEEMSARGLKSRTGKPLSLSRLAALLHNPLYTGRFVWAGVEYQGNHHPLISEELYQATQKKLAARNTAGTRERKHPHHLKGILYCVCGKRLSTTTAKGHTYFFCLGRDKCSEPTIRVESVEEQVESLYEGIRLPEAVLEALERELEGDAKRRAEHRYRFAEKLSGRLRALERERDKTMRAYLDDAISIDMLKREQKRITEEHALRSSQLATLSERIAQTEELVRLALRLVENCHEATGRRHRRRGNSLMRRSSNASSSSKRKSHRCTTRHRSTRCSREVLLAMIGGGKRETSGTLLTRSFAD